MFVDEADVTVEAGRGGDGAVEFRRERYNPKGGPTGGDGGEGGDVVFVATTNQHTLSAFRHSKRIEAEDGEPGAGKNQTGARGEDRVVEVPVGTVIYDARTDRVIADLDEEGDREVIAKGGERGFGNKQFVTPTNQAPRKSTPGKTGETKKLRLELKLIADVGLVGFPSVGKSTIVNTLSAATPKVADYHFTTRIPTLGTVEWKQDRDFVIADIPGLIEGANKGEGLGDRFLRHIERTGILVHVLEAVQEVEGVPQDRDPIEDFKVIEEELRGFNEELVERRQVVVLNKIDLPFVRDKIPEVRAFVEEERGLEFLPISAETGENMEEFVDLLGYMIYTGAEGGDEDLEWWETED